MRILILFAHPALEKSRLHRRLIHDLPDLPGLTFHDLYEEYPTFDIDVTREQALLTAHDLIILQHPMYWYSTPALLKQWQDLVLEHGWAYGSTGKALHGKRMLNLITSGGTEAAYQPQGYNRFTVRQFLAPIEQTARLCGMEYLPPYVIHGTHRMDEAAIGRARADVSSPLDRAPRGSDRSGGKPKWGLFQQFCRRSQRTRGGRMNNEGLFFQAFIYLTAAVAAVPIAKRLGLGSVLGYLLAGIVIGPFVLGLVGSEGQDVMHFAEFGVVMMLFVVGLELEPSLLWRLRAPILGLGGLQVTLTTAAVTGIAMLLGLAWQPALAIGMTLALSSTAIVLQTLNEKGLMKSAGGQSSFAVLLFQDIAVIPMLALFPLLATGHGVDDGHGAEATTLVASLPPWAQTLAVLGAVAAVIIGGRFLVRPLLRMIAQTRLREIFTAAALLLVVGIALLMTAVGLSPALGTFLAGVVLANSEYRHELESDIDPFKGLLLGLFFIAVGASIDFGLIFSQPLLIFGLVIAILVVKFAVLFALARGFRLGLDQSFLLAFALPQVGEFAFVLFSFANQEGVLETTITSPLVAVVALSMALTPLLMIVNEKLIQPRFGTLEKSAREADTIEEESPVLIAGFGSFGSTVGRLLKANGVQTTVLDMDSDRVDLLRRLGLKVYYGDASRYDLLETAGAAHAKLLVLALDSPEKTLELVHTARKHFPHLKILARAFDWSDAHGLLAAGVTHVYRQSLDTSLRMGTDALQALGFRAYQSQRAAQKFLRHDEAALHELTEQRGDRAEYINAARQRIEELEQLLLADLEDLGEERDLGWDAETLRADYVKLTAAEAK